MRTARVAMASRLIGMAIGVTIAATVLGIGAVGIVIGTAIVLTVAYLLYIRDMRKQARS